MQQKGDTDFSVSFFSPFKSLSNPLNYIVDNHRKGCEKVFVNSPQQLAEKKLLLLYILEKFEMPMAPSQLTDFVLENDLMNYFMLQQFLSELQESEFVVTTEAEDQDFFVITDKGKNTLQYFINRLSRELLVKIDLLLGKKKEQILKSTEVVAQYAKLDDAGVSVTLKVVEKEAPLIEIHLQVADTKQAKRICENWKQHTQQIYSQLISMLIDEKND